jgi:hypothetical protein
VAGRGEFSDILRGFDDTDILPFGGRLELVRPDYGAQVLLTYIPPFPRGQPETVWMRQPRTDTPALILNEPPNGGRVAYLPADIDRCYARDNLSDHATLLANLVRWAARDRIPLRVEGPGLIDCHLYQQPGQLIVHLVNLTNTAAWRAPVDEFTAIGPLRVRVQLPDDVHSTSARLLVSEDTTPITVNDGWAHFDVASILDHEVMVIE